MTKRVYEEIRPIAREDAMRELASGDAARVCATLVQLAFHEPDRAFVEDVLAQQLESSDASIRSIAALCVGHVARIHRALDVPRFRPLLDRLALDPATVGNVENALGDIGVFVERRAATHAASVPRDANEIAERMHVIARSRFRADVAVADVIAFLRPILFEQRSLLKAAAEGLVTDDEVVSAVCARMSDWAEARGGDPLRGPWDWDVDALGDEIEAAIFTSGEPRRTVRADKDATILRLLAQLELEKRGWVVTDWWDGDDYAIGIEAAGKPGRLVYVSTRNEDQGRYYYELEFPPHRAEDVYEPGASGVVGFEELLAIMNAHLAAV